MFFLFCFLYLLAYFCVYVCICVYFGPFFVFFLVIFFGRFHFFYCVYFQRERVHLFTKTQTNSPKNQGIDVFFFRHKLLSCMSQNENTCPIFWLFLWLYFLACVFVCVSFQHSSNKQKAKFSHIFFCVYTHFIQPNAKQ